MRQKLLLGAWCCLLVVGCSGTPPTTGKVTLVLDARQQEEQDRALDEVQKRGGLVMREYNGDGIFIDFQNESKIKDEDLEALRHIPKLDTLVLTGTSVTDAGLETLEGLTQLQGLYLGGDSITDAG